MQAIEPIILIIATVALYARTWSYHLVIDDVNRLARPSEPFKFMREIRGSDRGSHDTRVIYAEHVIGTVLHTIAVMIVYRLAGFFPALLFAVHPNALQTCVWLNGKRYVIGTIVALIALNEPRIAGVGLLTAAWQPSTIGAGLYAVFTGSSWTAIPIIALAIWMKIPQTVIKRIKSRDREIPASVIAPLTRVILSVKLYGAYFWRSVCPCVPAMFYPELGQYDMSDDDARRANDINGHFYAGIAALATSVWFMTLNPLFAVFPLSIAPYLHIMPRNIVQLNADRYAYCGAIGIFAVIGTFPAVSIVLVAWYAVVTFIGSEQYKNITAFTEYNLKQYPNSYRAAYYHALKQWEAGNDSDAIMTLKEGLRHNPMSHDLNYMAGVLYHQFGNYARAVECLTVARKNVFHGQEQKQREKCDKFLRALSV